MPWLPKIAPATATLAYGSRVLIPCDWKRVIPDSKRESPNQRGWVKGLSSMRRCDPKAVDNTLSGVEWVA